MAIKTFDLLAANDGQSSRIPNASGRRRPIARVDRTLRSSLGLPKTFATRSTESISKLMFRPWTPTALGAWASLECTHRREVDQVNLRVLPDSPGPFPFPSRVEGAAGDHGLLGEVWPQDGLKPISHARNHRAASTPSRCLSHDHTGTRGPPLSRVDPVHTTGSVQKSGRPVPSGLEMNRQHRPGSLKARSA